MTSATTRVRTAHLAFTLPVLLLCAGIAAGAANTAAIKPPAPKPVAPQTDSKATADDLSEINVTAEKPTRKVSDLIVWIRRLLGQYTIDGKVDMGGKGNPNERWTAVGTGTCIGFGVAPGVQCEMNVKWPPVPGPHGAEVLSGVTDLNPAMMLLGMQPDDIGIQYLQVNNKGLAEGSVGTIINDTATFKTPCVNAPPGCMRIMRITAESESKVISMDIDTEIDYQLAARFNFKLRRVAELQAPKDNPTEKDKAASPVAGKAAADSTQAPAARKK